MTGCECVSVCVWLWFACEWLSVYVLLCEPREENKEKEEKNLRLSNQVLVPHKLLHFPPSFFPFDQYSLYLWRSRFILGREAVFKLYF